MLSDRYQKDMEALYTALEERQKERLRAMKEGRDGSVADRIKQVSSPWVPAGMRICLRFACFPCQPCAEAGMR